MLAFESKDPPTSEEDFSRDDDLPSSDNEDKVFNPGILIHEKSVKIITRVAQEKKLAISYASLLFEDFDPPFFEPFVFKDVPNSMRLLLFSSENEEKVFKPGINTSKKRFRFELSWSSERSGTMNLSSYGRFRIEILIKIGPATSPATSRHAKAATEVYLRRDHVAAHESFQRLKKNEAANASFLHAKGNSIFEQATHCTPYLRMAKTDMVAASAATFDYEPNPNVTLISKLDGSRPLHLHPNDSSTLTFVSIKLKGAENYNFLMGLDDSYMQLMSNILPREPLLDAKSACALISSEKSHRAVVIGSGVGTSQRSQSYVFNFGVNNRGNTQRPQTSGNTSRPNNVPRPNNNRNKRATCRPT
nr:ribonuclease H-like domain-containing protein [Tanacetum cinerariifolium]